MKTIDLDKVKKTFYPLNPPNAKRPPKYQPCRIRVGGQLVAVNNGKSLWRQVGHCKSAIRNHLDRVAYGFAGTTYASRQEAVDYVMANWVGVGPEFPIEIVLITEVPQ